MNIKFFLKKPLAILFILMLGTNLFSAKTKLVAVSADIVEIRGSLSRTVGFSWTDAITFGESRIPSMFTLGEFERLTALQTTLRLLETEGKAQILSNPKVIAKTGTTANFLAGGSFPVPYANSSGGIGADFKDYGVALNVLPTIIVERGNVIDVQIELELSRPDYSRPLVIAGTTIPAINSRKMSTHVELDSGETLVISGLKTSSKDTSYRRVPFLGRIPLIGALFTNKETVEEQVSLFLFVTVEIVE
ncbi:MAG: type II and III secretion system protein [Elusimicrobiaceae bacterium]|jgi:pilus assembly protein CpaC|nr:type II and III secretion system protein [Elusimicrobiaceae bacterium]MBT3954632.1 type II and III secretion system protein [Elusimicrobiaceae bacterium]MBT4007940.1 type II and III secretion system protein [Elusimicrobiaceae bacterium]MBT4403134.1 type II and III secretion system protein [Elusimicrobiaceae bacterium]MBT4439954.1 type II and III secretion system protein [Elusimicrobiaceae bacterium]